MNSDTPDHSILNAKQPDKEIVEALRLQRASRIATGVLLFVLVGCSAAAFNGTPLMGLLAFFLLVPLTFLTFFQTNISKKISHLMQLMADEGAREVQKKAFDESPTHDALPPKRG